MIRYFVLTSNSCTNYLSLKDIVTVFIIHRRTYESVETVNDLWKC